MPKHVKCNALTIMFDVVEGNTTAACDAAAFVKYLKWRKQAPCAPKGSGGTFVMEPSDAGKCEQLADVSDYLDAILRQGRRAIGAFPEPVLCSWESYCVLEWFVEVEDRIQARLFAKRIREEARKLGLVSYAFERFGPPPVCPYAPIELAFNYNGNGYFLGESGRWKYNADFVF